MKLDQITVAGKQINAALFEGEHYVSIQSMCVALGLAPQDQLIKLRKNEDFNIKDILYVALDGKTRTVACLTAKQATGWLYTINTNKVKPETRQFLKEFKTELEDVIHQYYNGGAVFNKRAYQDDPYEALKFETQQRLKMIEEIIEERRLNQMKQAIIEQQEIDGSLRFRDGYKSCAMFAMDLKGDDQVRYNKKGTPQKLGFACSQYCRDNNIPVELSYTGSHHKEVNGYPEFVLKLIWATPFDEEENDDWGLFANNPCFTF